MTAIADQTPMSLRAAAGPKAQCKTPPLGSQRPLSLSRLLIPILTGLVIVVEYIVITIDVEGFCSIEENLGHGGDIMFYFCKYIRYVYICIYLFLSSFAMLCLLAYGCLFLITLRLRASH